MTIGNTLLSENQIVQLKHKLTEWGLLDPSFAREGDPRKQIEHSSNWNSFCVDGAENLLRLFGQDDADGTIDTSEYDLIMKRGNPQPLKPNDAKTRKLVKAYEQNKWYIARGNDVYNVTWIEDFNRDWTGRIGVLDTWDDMVVLWQAEHNGTVRIIEEFWQATTEPGAYYTFNPMNAGGAARIAFGQYITLR